jgi:hypothetical protein
MLTKLTKKAESLSDAKMREAKGGYWMCTANCWLQFLDLHLGDCGGDGPLGVEIYDSALHTLYA